MWKIRLEKDGTGGIANANGDSIGQKFAKKVTKSTLFGNGDTGLLPPGVRYVNRDRTICLIERPPTQVVLEYYGVLQNQINKDTVLQQYEIWLPWTLYVFSSHSNRLSSARIYALRGGIKTFFDQLYFLPIPNTYDDAQFCLPPAVAEESNIDSLASLIANGYSAIWDSKFNMDTDALVRQAHDLRLPHSLFPPELTRSRDKRVSFANMARRWEMLSAEEAKESIPIIEVGLNINELLTELGVSPKTPNFVHGITSKVQY